MLEELKKLGAVFLSVIVILAPTLQSCKPSRPASKVLSASKSSAILEQQIRSRMYEIHQEMKQNEVGRLLPEQMRPLFDRLLDESYLSNVRKTILTLMEKRNLAIFKDEHHFPDGHALYEGYIANTQLLKVKLLNTLRGHPAVKKLESPVPGAAQYGVDSYDFAWPINEIMDYLFDPRQGYQADLALAGSPAQKRQNLTEIGNILHELALNESELLHYKAKTSLNNLLHYYQVTFAEPVNPQNLGKLLASPLTDTDRERLTKYRDYLLQVTTPLYSKIKEEMTVKLGRVPGSLSAKNQEIQANRFYAQAEAEIRQFFYQILASEMKLRGLNTGEIGTATTFRLYDISSGSAWQALVDLIISNPDLLALLETHLTQFMVIKPEIGYPKARKILLGLFGLNFDQAIYMNTKTYQTYQEDLGMGFQAINEPTEAQVEEIIQILDWLAPDDLMVADGTGADVQHGFVPIMRKKLLQLPYFTDLGPTKLNDLVAQDKKSSFAAYQTLIQYFNVLFVANTPQETTKVYNISENRKIMTAVMEGFASDHLLGELQKRAFSESIGVINTYLTQLFGTIEFYLPVITYRLGKNISLSSKQALYNKFKETLGKAETLVGDINSRLKNQLPIYTADDKPYIKETETFVTNWLAKFADKDVAEANESFDILESFNIKAVKKESVPVTMDPITLAAVGRVINPEKDQAVAAEQAANLLEFKSTDSEAVTVFDFFRQQLKLSYVKMLVEATKPLEVNQTHTVDLDALKTFKQDLLTNICLISGLPDEQQKLLGSLYFDLLSVGTTGLAILNLQHWFTNATLEKMLDIITHLFLVKEQSEAMGQNPVTNAPTSMPGMMQQVMAQTQGGQGAKPTKYISYKLREMKNNPLVNQHLPAQYQTVIQSILSRINEFSLLIHTFKQNLQEQQTGLALDFNEIIQHIHLAPKKEEGQTGSNLPMPDVTFTKQFEALIKRYLKSVEDMEAWQKSHPGSMDLCGPFNATKEFLDSWYGFYAQYNFVGKDKAIRDIPYYPKNYYIEKDGNPQNRGTGPYTFDKREFMMGMFGNNPCSEIKDYELPQTSSLWSPEIMGDDGVYMPFLDTFAFGEKEEAKKDRSLIFVPMATAENGCQPRLDPTTNLWKMDSKKCPKFYLPKLHQFLWVGADNWQNYVKNLGIQVGILMVVIALSNFTMVPIMSYVSEMVMWRFVASTFINPFFFTVYHILIHGLGRKIYADKYGEHRYFTKVHLNLPAFVGDYLHNVVIFGILHASGFGLKKLYPGFYSWSERAAMAKFSPLNVTNGKIVAPVVPANLQTGRLLQRTLPILKHPVTVHSLNTVSGAFFLSLEAFYVSPMFMIYQADLEKHREKGEDDAWQKALVDIMNRERPEWSASTFQRIFLDNLAFFVAIMGQGPLVQGTKRVWHFAKYDVLQVKETLPGFLRKVGWRSTYDPGDKKQRQSYATRWEEVQGYPKLLNNGKILSEKTPVEIDIMKSMVKAQKMVIFRAKERGIDVSTLEKAKLLRTEIDLSEHGELESTTQFMMQNVLLMEEHALMRFVNSQMWLQPGKFLKVNLNDVVGQKAIQAYRFKFMQLKGITGLIETKAAMERLALDPSGRFSKNLTDQQIYNLAEFMQNPANHKLLASRSEQEFADAFERHGVVDPGDIAKVFAEFQRQEADKLAAPIPPLPDAAGVLPGVK